MATPNRPNQSQRVDSQAQSRRSGKGDGIDWGIKTEEEEYLAKLEAKLASLKSRESSGSRSQGSRDPSSTHLNHDPADAHPSSSVVPIEGEEGVHLLYDSERLSASAQPGAGANSLGLSIPGIPPVQPPSPTEGSDDDPASETAPNNDAVDEPPPTLRRPRAVRFHSRVRITSGIHVPHRHSGSATLPPSGSYDSSAASSVSTSSSISAPLREAEEFVSRPERIERPRALSEIMTTDAASAWLKADNAVARRARIQNRRPRGHGNPTVDERTPFAKLNGGVNGVGTQASYSSVEGIEEGEDDDEIERLRQAKRKSEEEVMFGKWPRRLINGHWWWWKIDAFFTAICICCLCAEDDDDD